MCVFGTSSDLAVLWEAAEESRRHCQLAQVAPELTNAGDEVSEEVPAVL